MNPVLFSIYGPLAIHSYGLCVAIGTIITFYLIAVDKKLNSILNHEKIITCLELFLFGGYFGGRIAFMISEQHIDPIFLFEFWKPGFTVLGGMIGAPLCISIYLYSIKSSILKVLDRGIIYTPIAQAFGRLGCFFTGCCYGAPTNAWYAITYTHENHMAPLFCSLHPTQLYSAILLFCIFLFLYFIQQNKTEKAGILFCSYLILASAERFLVDFIRWDQVFFSTSGILQLFSIYQWIALAIAINSAIALFIINNKKA